MARVAFLAFVIALTAICATAQRSPLPVVEKLVIEPAVPAARTPFTVKCIVGTGYGLLGPARIDVAAGVISIHFRFGRLAWIGPFPLPVRIPPVPAGTYMVRVIVWTQGYEDGKATSTPWTIATTMVRVREPARRRSARSDLQMVTGWAGGLTAARGRPSER